MSKQTLVLSLCLVAAVVLAAPAVGGTRHRARHVPKAMRLAAADTGTGRTPTGMLRFGYRDGSLVCFGRFAHLAPDAQYQFQWGAQGPPPTTFTANGRGRARFVTAAPPTDPTAGSSQASVTPVDASVPVLYCDWNWTMFGGVPTAGGTRTPPDPATTPPTQGGSSAWGGMGCGWR